MICPISKEYLIISILFISLGIFFGCEWNGQNENIYPEAENQGFDSQALANAIANAKTINSLQGLAVARNGVIVAEEYAENADSLPDTILHVMSVTKSITSTLVGIAIKEGFIKSVDQTLSDFLAEEVDSINPELGEITIHQLMTMTAGQDWHELGGDSEFTKFANAPDQLNYVMEKPIVNSPGTVFNYSDGAAHLVSVIISKATGMSASVFADKYLFGPMGLDHKKWFADNQEFSFGGVGLCIGIHDMINIGYLFLNEGFHNGNQVVPSDWIKTVTDFKISTGNVIPFLTDYGYFWWLGNARGHDFICANGYGGQFIFIVKDLKLIVCSRSDYRLITSTKAGENWYEILDIIINQILTSVLN